MFEYAIPARNLIYYIALAVIMLAGMMLFFRIRFRRDHLAARISLGVLAYLAILFFCYTGFLCYILPVANRLLFLLLGTLVLYWILVDVDPKLVLMSGILLYFMLLFPLTVISYVLTNATFHLAWQILIIVAVCCCDFFISWFYFIRQIRRNAIAHLTASLIALSVVRVVITAVLFNLLIYMGLSNTLPGFICYIAWVECNALLIGSECKRTILSYNMQIQKLLDEEKEKQYEAFKNNIDIINIKCHDLRRYTNEIKEREELGGTAEYMDEITSALNVYESISNTGNSELDAVLSEKKSICDRDGITMDYVIEASGLGFMTGFDIYTLFSNAMENAIEACRREPADRRLLSVHVGRRGGFLYIIIENYSSTAPVFLDGIPMTSKSDDRYHGYGLISIRKTAQKYGGTAEYSYENMYFIVSILLPMSGTPPKQHEEGTVGEAEHASASV